VTTAVVPVVVTEMGAGNVSAGGVLSCTVTVNDFEADGRPWLSVAVQATVVVVTGNVDPDAGVQVAESGPSCASFAVAVNVTTAPLAEVASTVMFDGTVTTGAVFWTVTVNVPDPVLFA
jgi:hypothetical protein